MSRSPPNPTLQSPVLQLVVFSIEGQRYALPLHAVERVLPMVAVSPLPQAPAVALGVINVHGRVVPVLDLRRRFGLPLPRFRDFPPFASGIHLIAIPRPVAYPLW